MRIKAPKLPIRTPSMSRFVKKRKEDIGLAPDDMSFRGEQKMNKVIMRLIDYDAQQLEQSTLASVTEVLKYRDSATVTWFNIDGLARPQCHGGHSRQL